MEEAEHDLYQPTNALRDAKESRNSPARVLDVEGAFYNTSHAEIGVAQIHKGAGNTLAFGMHRLSEGRQI